MAILITFRRLAAACALATLVGCAGPKAIDIPPDTLSAVPMRDVDEAQIGAQFLWGGVIVETRNLDRGTRIEMLAYPLDARQRPITSRAAIGRFLLESDVYLEPVDYAAGRHLSVYGTYERTEAGQVGETRYDFPVLAVTTLHLWRPEERRVRPQLSIGVGFEL